MAYEIPEILAPVGSVSGISTHRMLVAIFQQLLQILKLINLIVIHQALKPFMEGLLLKGLERFAAFAKERNSKIPQPWRSLQCKNSRIWSVSFPLKHDYHNRRLHIVTADVGKIMYLAGNKEWILWLVWSSSSALIDHFYFCPYDYTSLVRCHHKMYQPAAWKMHLQSDCFESNKKYG